MNAIKIHSRRSDEEEQIFILLTKENAKHIFPAFLYQREKLPLT